MCKSKAEWTIVHGRSPDDYTEACTKHVGELLTDAQEHRIYRIFDEPADRAPALCCFIITIPGEAGKALESLLANDET